MAKPSLSLQMVLCDLTAAFRQDLLLPYAGFQHRGRSQGIRRRRTQVGVQQNVSLVAPQDPTIHNGISGAGGESGTTAAVAAAAAAWGA